MHVAAVFLVLIIAIWNHQYEAAPTGNVSSILFKSLNDRIKLCGSALSETLLILCDGIYTQPDELDESEEVPHPEIRTEETNVLKKNLQRLRRAVADECCLVPCFVDELLNYCGTKRLKYLKYL